MPGEPTFTGPWSNISKRDTSPKGRKRDAFNHDIVFLQYNLELLAQTNDVESVASIKRSIARLITRFEQVHSQGDASGPRKARPKLENLLNRARAAISQEEK